MQKILKDIYYIESCNDATFDSVKYIIDTKSSDGIVIIDPGLYIKFIQDFEKNGFSPKRFNHCLITHGHLDHFGACYELKQFNKNIRFYAHELDAVKIEQKLEREFIEETYPGYDYTPIKISKKIKGDNEILTFGNYELKCIHTPGHSPGAVAYFLERGKTKILFGGDVGGWSLRIFDGNIDEYLNSMQKLLDLNADILCDGHEGAIKPAKKVSEYIQDLMKFNHLSHIAIEKDLSSAKAWYELTLHTYEMGEHSYALDFCNHLLEIDPDNSNAHRLIKKIKKHNPIKIDFIQKILEKVSNTHKEK
ncbi:MAG: MBL fold metallo-hydrolase [Promethearchaeota archaeon]|jgi:glyoxylase-like metal-dependent hydrolase (beta-lactamase superfamily II)